MSAELLIDKCVRCQTYPCECLYVFMVFGLDINDTVHFLSVFTTKQKAEDYEKFAIDTSSFSLQFTWVNRMLVK